MKIELRVINISIDNETFLDNEDFRDLDLIGLFSGLCEDIDEKNIAVFGVEVDGKPLANRMDFKYDFTSIMPELHSLRQFLASNNDDNGSFHLSFYALDKTIVFTKSSVNGWVNVIAYANKWEEFARYDIRCDEILFPIDETLRRFEALVMTCYPKIYDIFMAENYLGFYKV